jgi:hypothetical protein
VAPIKATLTWVRRSLGESSPRGGTSDIELLFLRQRRTEWSELAVPPHGNNRAANLVAPTRAILEPETNRLLADNAALREDNSGLPEQLPF